MSASPRVRAWSPVDAVFRQTATVQAASREQLRTLPQVRESRITNFTQTTDRTLTAANRPALALDIPVNPASADVPAIEGAPPASVGAYLTLAYRFGGAAIYYP